MSAEIGAMNPTYNYPKLITFALTTGITRRIGDHRIRNVNSRSGPFSNCSSKIKRYYIFSKSKIFSMILIEMNLITPATCSVALEVRPRTCENNNKTKYSKRLFERWSLTIAILEVATTVSVAFMLSHIRHRFT